MPDFESYDLIPIHFLLSLIGATLAIWIMQLAAHDKIECGERGCLRILRRGSIAVVAIALGWSCIYSFDRQWQPWPPFLLLNIGLDLAMTGAIISAYLRPERAQ